MIFLTAITITFCNACISEKKIIGKRPQADFSSEKNSYYTSEEVLFTDLSDDEGWAFLGDVGSLLQLILFP